MSGEIRLRGLEEFKLRLAALGGIVREAAAAALYVEANKILTASKRFVPVDLGALRASGFVAAPVIEGAVVSVSIGYGGPSVKYALPVHEIPPPPARSVGGRSARHNPPTQWKYLERPAREAMPGMDLRLSNAMRSNIEQAVRRGPAR